MDEQTTVSLRSGADVAEPVDDTSSTVPDDDLGPEDLFEGMDDMFEGTGAPRDPTGSATPTDEAAAQLRVAVESTLEELSARSVVRQSMMGMNQKVDSVTSLSGDRSESVMAVESGLSTYYRFVDGIVYVRQEGAGTGVLGIELDKWAVQPGDPAVLRRQMEAMTGVDALRQLPTATAVGSATPGEEFPRWDVDEVLAFALIWDDAIRGTAHSSGLAGIRDGRIVELKLSGDAELRIAGRSSGRWMPFEAHVSFLDFGATLARITVPSQDEMAD